MERERTMPEVPGPEERTHIETPPRDLTDDEKALISELKVLPRLQLKAENKIRKGVSLEIVKNWAEKKGQEAQRAERFGKPPEPVEGWKYEWIHSQQLGDMPVEWPETQEAAEKHIKDVLGRIEIAQSSVTQQMQVDYQNAQAVLEILETRNEDEDEAEHEKDFIDKQKKWATKMRDEIKARIELHQAFLKYEGGGSIKEVHEAMIGIYGGRLDVIFGLKEKIPGTNKEFNPFVMALQYYEDHGHEFARANSEKDRPNFSKKVQEYLVAYVAKERGIDPSTLKGEEYHWAQNMAERLFRATGRAIMYDYLVINKDKENERAVKWDYDGPEKAEWASGRDGCDYPMSKIYRFRENLKAEEGLMRSQIHLLDGVDILAGDFWTRTVGESYVKIPGNEPLFEYRNVDKAERDERFRIIEENIRKQSLFAGWSEKETQDRVDKALEEAEKANRENAYVHQMNEEDIEAKREELIQEKIKEIVAKKEMIANKRFEGEEKKYVEEEARKEVIKKYFINKKIKDLTKQNQNLPKDRKRSKDEIEEEARRETEREVNEGLYKEEVKGKEAYKKEAENYLQEIYDADKYGDRPSEDNEGEVIKKINFSLMERKLAPDGTLIEGIDFIKMSATPMSLWVSRMLDGPESAKDPLSGSREAFLLNPNFKSLGKLLGAFDYSKANSWKVKEQLIKNFVKFARSKEYESMGRNKLTETQILSGVNELTGINNPDAPQFIQLQERTRILAELFNIKLSERDNEKINNRIEKIRKQVEAEEFQLAKKNNPDKPDDDIRKEIIGKVDEAVRKARISTTSSILDGKIENRINRGFAARFAGWFLWGVIKEALKQAIPTK